MFETEFEKFLEEQKRGVTGQRLRMLESDLTGTKKLLKEVLLPVIGSWDDFILEFEMVSLSNASIYLDVFSQSMFTAFEADGFVSHGENLTRDRFSFERVRVRTMMISGMKYMPFSWDELTKKPEQCRRAVYELMGRSMGRQGNMYTELDIYEREIIRFAIGLNRPIRLADARYCLGMGNDTSIRVLRSLVAKQLLKPIGTGKQRYHEYMLTEKAFHLLR